ncbi:unnamed protein product [Symbiodinium sp. KB8]|nr:unnamed protein product [Symbiodinium sp. KB8]
MNSIQDMQKRVELLMLPAEKKMAQCQLKCFNDMSNADIVHRCAQGCQSQMQSVVTQVQGEFQGLIARLKTCEESVKQKLAPQMERAEGAVDREKVQRDFEEGLQKCVKPLQPMVHEVEGRVKAIISQAVE